MCGPSVVTDSIELVRLWAHETLRVFQDRLVDDDDRLVVHEKVVECAQKHFAKDFHKVLFRLCVRQEEEETERVHGGKLYGCLRGHVLPLKRSDSSWALVI